jgi:hypothetical protein
MACESETNTQRLKFAVVMAKVVGNALSMFVIHKRKYAYEVFSHCRNKYLYIHRIIFLPLPLFCGGGKVGMGFFILRHEVLPRGRGGITRGVILVGASLQTFHNSLKHRVIEKGNRVSFIFGRGQDAVYGAFVQSIRPNFQHVCFQWTTIANVNS